MGYSCHTIANIIHGSLAEHVCILKPASMTMKYLKCRVNLNFEVDFGLNDTLSTITSW